MIVKRLADPPKYRYGGSSRLNYSKYRYGGNGIFSNLISKTLSGDNVKNLINTVSKSKIVQKAADAVLEGATNAVKTQTQRGLEGLSSSAFSSIKKKKNKWQDRIVNTRIQDRAATIPTIESVIGRGIVYD